MNVNPVNIYNKYDVRTEVQTENLQTLINQNSQKVLPKQRQEAQKDQLSLDLRDKNKIITPQEREFFVKMFPESSMKIENHVLFDRNGRLQSKDVAKGTIIDARV